MNNLDAFKIRLELLKMAKDMLYDEYYSKRELALRDYDNKVARLLKGEDLPALPVLPAIPIETEIIAKASTFNAFVSDKI